MQPIKSNRLLKTSRLLAVVGLLAVASSCDERNNNDTPAPSNACTEDEQYLRGISGDARDSAYLITKTLYLWEDNLPCFVDFQPKAQSNLEQLMQRVRTFSPRNSQGRNFDRFSFAIPIPQWDNIASGREFDFGTGFRFATGTEDDLRISYVYAASSAGRQGVQRGWRVLSANGVAATRANLDALNAELNKNSAQIEFQRPDGSRQTLTLNAAEYQANFILKKQVIAAGDRRVAYLAFNSFLGDDTDDQLRAAFDEFRAAGANDLVVDLRYNGGGYVSYQQLLANLIATQNAKGKVMTRRKYNPLLTDEFRRRNINLTTNFNNQAPTLNINRVVFITTGSTASASELLINSLQPHMEVKVVGRPSAGKPVGFRNIPIITNRANPAANYYVFPVEFQSVNAADFGDYFDGLPVDATAPDDVTRDFGDPDETSLRVALTYLRTGTLQSARTSVEGVVNAEIDRANEKLNPVRFQGAIISDK
jgi:hypothetical protein